MIRSVYAEQEEKRERNVLGGLFITKYNNNNLHQIINILRTFGIQLLYECRTTNNAHLLDGFIFCQDHILIKSGSLSLMVIDCREKKRVVREEVRRKKESNRQRSHNKLNLNYQNLFSCVVLAVGGCHIQEREWSSGTIFGLK